MVRFGMRTAARACALAALVGASVVVASPASAHVTVNSPDAEPGGFGKMVFRVPTESDTASTTKLTITLPDDTPFAFVNAERVPGWDMDMTKEQHDEPVKAGDFKVTETVSEVTWTADDDSAIAPGEFGEFAISVGPLPEEAGSELVFAADQGYSDGSTVSWDEPTPDSGEEPENPAPTLTLQSGGDTAAAGAADGAANAPVDSTDASNTPVLPIIALVVSILAAVIAGVTGGLVIRDGRRNQ